MVLPMRLPDWQLRFAKFAASRQRMPFAWGSNDCCFFAADAVYAITGEDFGAAWRGRYDSAATAAITLKDCDGLRAVATFALGAEIGIGYASVGDVVLVENAGREMLAICNGTSAIGPGANGITSIDMTAALAAWRV
jgi:hypothetical protein